MIQWIIIGTYFTTKDYFTFSWHFFFILYILYIHKIIHKIIVYYKYIKMKTTNDSIPTLNILYFFLQDKPNNLFFIDKN